MLGGSTSTRGPCWHHILYTFVGKNTTAPWPRENRIAETVQAKESEKGIDGEMSRAVEAPGQGKVLYGIKDRQEATRR